MFDEKELATELKGVTVKDAFVALQILEKASNSGVIKPVEYEAVSEYRKSIVAGIEAGIGKNYDQMVLAVQQAQFQAEQAKQQEALEKHRQAASTEASE